jgi:uncharacterized membrane-anchored protein
MRQITILISILFFSFTSSFAKTPTDSLKLIMDQLKKMDSIEKTLHYKTGAITIGDNIATITVPRGFTFLESSEAKYVLEDLWGNQKGQSPLGLLFPEGSTASNPANYVFVVEYEAMGYVKDNDADKINYDDLLKELRESQAKANIDRKTAGLSTMDLVGWAATPHYDKERKLLYWAKEYKVEGEEEHTLNYDIRVLGRKGVLILQAVSSMAALDSVNKNVNNVLSMVSFTEGNKYSDYNSKTDAVAAWTIGGLVAGKILAKVGFFAVILKFLKFIILGVAAIGGGIWRFITGRRKKEEEFVYQPQPAPVDNPSEPQ